MHISLIIRALAFLSLVVCVAMIPCAVVSVGYGEMQAFHGFLQSILLLLIPAVILVVATSGADKSTLTIRDGFFLVFFAWLSISFFASIPFQLSGVFTNWADSFFEASSGITTTGATVMTDIDNAPHGIALWRSITHWMGGMGIVMLSVALMPLLGVGGMQLFKAESGGIDREKLTPRIAQTAKYLWFIYTGFTTVSFLFLIYGGMGVFDAVNHAFSSISSGGFSTKNASMGYFDSSFIQWVTIGTMFVSGVSFALYYKLFTGNVKTVAKNTELKAYVFIILAASGTVAFVNYLNGIYSTSEENVRYAVFQVVSVVTSTGYSTTDYNIWPSLCQFVLLVLMFVGGCAGSTAGGFKVVRIVILLKQAVIELRRLVHPRGVFMLRLNGSTISKEMIYSVSGFLFLYLFSVTVVAAVAAISGVDMITAITTGLALIGNIGPGFGLVGPAETFAFYPSYVKWVMGVAMIVGRLEIYTFFMFLMPFFWRKI